jgi:hypothetical protein
MKNAQVSEEFARKFASEKETPYTRWVKGEGLEIISSFYVPNLHTVELRPRTTAMCARSRPGSTSRRSASSSRR